MPHGGGVNGEEDEDEDDGEEEESPGGRGDGRVKECVARIESSSSSSSNRLSAGMGPAGAEAATAAASARRREAEALATKVISRARSEVEAEGEAPTDDAGTPLGSESARRRVSTASSIDDGETSADRALDWAAAIERDELEAAAMRHGLDDVDDASSGVADADENWRGGASAVCTQWRDAASREAERLRRLHAESQRHRAEWERERLTFEALRAEVQAELKREARQHLLAGGGPSSPASPDADEGALSEELARTQQQMRREQARARSLRRERTALESELHRRQRAVADLEERLGRLRAAL